jgi:hypothetical protein
MYRNTDRKFRSARTFWPKGRTQTSSYSSRPLHKSVCRQPDPVSYLDIQESDQTHYCGSMYQDENPSNISTSFPLMGAPTDYPCGPAYAPLMDSCSVIGPASGYVWGLQQAQNLVTAPAPSNIAQSRQPDFRYREIRPRPLDISAPIIPPMNVDKEEQHSQHRKLRRGKHSKRQRQLDHEQVPRTTKKAPPAVCEAADTISQPMRNDKMRFAWLYF